MTITREQIFDALRSQIAGNTDALWDLFTEQDEQYQDLVQAAINWSANCKSTIYGDGSILLSHAVQPFLPPKPSLFERLNALKDLVTTDNDEFWREELIKCADEAKQLEATIDASNAPPTLIPSKKRGRDD